MPQDCSSDFVLVNFPGGGIKLNELPATTLVDERASVKVEPNQEDVSVKVEPGQGATSLSNSNPSVRIDQEGVSGKAEPGQAADDVFITDTKPDVVPDAGDDGIDQHDISVKAEPGQGGEDVIYTDTKPDVVPDAPDDGHLFTELQINELIKSLMSTRIFRGPLTQSQLDQIVNQLQVTYGFGRLMNMDHIQCLKGGGHVPNFLTRIMLRALNPNARHPRLNWTFFPDFIIHRSAQLDPTHREDGEHLYLRVNNMMNEQQLMSSLLIGYMYIITYPDHDLTQKLSFSKDLLITPAV
ncbi:hypothetical protein MJO29_003610 [Puccinia striiformis f. sp. tritici]|nr:hypothetical protein MJO29_003610 [Puccinia striiformis f. sp. tritici]